MFPRDVWIMLAKACPESRSTLARTCSLVNEALVEDACAAGVHATAFPDDLAERWRRVRRVRVLRGDAGIPRFPAHARLGITCLRVDRVVDAKFWAAAFAGCPDLEAVEYVPRVWIDTYATALEGATELLRLAGRLKTLRVCAEGVSVSTTDLGARESIESNFGCVLAKCMETLDLDLPQATFDVRAPNLRSARVDDTRIGLLQRPALDGLLHLPECVRWLAQARTITPARLERLRHVPHVTVVALCGGHYGSRELLESLPRAPHVVLEIM